MQESSIYPFSQTINPRKHIRLKYPDLRSSRFSPKPDCRSTDLLSGRPDQSTEINREFGSYSQGISVDRPVDRLRPCACCACRSTGPVDRSAYFLLLSPLPFVIDFLGDLRQHLAILTILGNNLSFQQFSISVKISKSEPNTDSIAAAPTWLPTYPCPRDQAVRSSPK